MLKFEIDSGAAVSVLNEHDARKVGACVRPTSRTALGYNGGKIHLVGETTLFIQYDNISVSHTFLVAGGNNFNLFGRDLFSKFNVHVVINPEKISSLSLSVLDEFSYYLSRDFHSCVKDQVHLDVSVEAKPVYSNARQIPLRLREPVRAELNRLVKEGVLTPVYSSKWATPIVTIYKKDGNLRICADFSRTVNKHLKPVHSPLVTIDEAIAFIGNAQVFSKIDLAQAFLQLPVHPSFQDYLVINTSEGLFKFNYLPFGLTASPGIFQAYISKVLANIPGVICYQDDILVMTQDVASHNDALRQVLGKLQKAGLKLNAEKSTFFTDTVQYLGYTFSKAGVLPNPDKINAIVNAPAPSDVKQLQSFIGICNFYCRFIHKFSSLMSPLYELLKKNVTFVWKETHQNAFEAIKDLFSRSNLLQHFNPNLETCLETDSSSYGIGAVLQQRVSERDPWMPVQYASRTLNNAERNYSQIEREGLSVIFGVNKFRHFLLGGRFVIRNDHKPLHTLFAKDKCVPNSCSARVLRWALMLNQYDYEFCYSKGCDNVQSDFLSRMPLPETTPESEPYELVFSIDSVDQSIITYEQVKADTDRDDDLVVLKSYIRYGCPTRICNSKLSKIKSCIPHMTLLKGCVMYYNRVLIPESLRLSVLNKLHENHPGIVSMKSRAREIVWWPGLDGDIERIVGSCHVCQTRRAKPPQNAHVTWPAPDRPWSRIHIDHFFYDSNICLIIVDALSRYIEVEVVKNTSVAETVDTLKVIFSRQGLPDILCSDNASCFTAFEFSRFVNNNGIKHITSPPYMPASNGLAERGVRVIKDLLNKLQSKDSFRVKLAKVLFYYRVTPHNVTHIAPSVALNNRKLVSALDRINPSYCCREDKMSEAKKIVQYEIGDKVLALNMSGGPKWYVATVIEKLGINVYNVHVHDLDIVWKRHKNQLMLTGADESTDSTETLVDNNVPCNPVPNIVSYPNRVRRQPVRLGIDECY